jgi:hypothetical protein
MFAHAYESVKKLRAVATYLVVVTKSFESLSGDLTVTANLKVLARKRLYMLYIVHDFLHRVKFSANRQITKPLTIDRVVNALREGLVDIVHTASKCKQAPTSPQDRY